MPSQLSTSAGCCQPCDSTPVTVNVPGPQGPAGSNGTNGTDGVDTYTTTTASFVVPASGNTVTITLDDVSFIPISYSDNIFLAIANAGYFSVTSVNTTNNTVVIKNPASALLGLPNAPVTTVIPAATKVSLAGGIGPAGATGPSSGNAPANASYITLNPDPTLSNETALSGLAAGYLRTYVSSGSGVLVTDPTISVGSISGVLPIAKGGLGINSTPVAGGIPIGTGAGYSVATITAGTGLTVTNSAGGITIGLTVGSSLTEIFKTQTQSTISSSATDVNVYTSIAAASGIDTQSGWNSTLGRYVVQTTGYYKFVFIITCASSTTTSDCYFMLKKNGSIVFQTALVTVTSSPGYTFQIEFLDKITNNATDYFEVHSRNVSHPLTSTYNAFMVTKLASL